ncbi:putative metallocarboxypeptidase ecm14 [Agyrium rufum]|nr:putative metallocarboxypeptidase ecm14 [Agyrium rufum]
MHDLALTIYESYPSPLTDDLPNPISFAPSTSFSPIRKVPDDALPSPQNVFFQNYQPLSVINPWLNLLASLFSTHVTLINIGTTAEGRSIHGLRVGVHPKVNSSCTSLPRKTIVITGGAHAREWISVSTVNYVAYTLITSYGKPKHSTKDLLETFDFVFIPTLNPDGYVYTWENDRLWRKSRQDTNLRFCPGLDLDRSFGFEWDNAATSSNPCSESFSGEGPFEAVEAKAFAEWVRNETATGEREIIAFLDLHSYSQQVLYPYSFSCSEVPAGWEDLMEVGMGFAKAVRRERGGVYGVTSACEGSVSIMGREVSNDPTAEVAEKKRRRMWPKLEAGGGSALDWMYHEVHVRYAYQIKLRDTGAWGFLLPPKEIVPTGKEVWAAVHWFGEYLLGNKGIESESNDFLNEETESPESIYLKPMEEPEEVNRDGTNHGNAEEGMENKGSPWEL